MLGSPDPSDTSPPSCGAESCQGVFGMMLDEEDVVAIGVEIRATTLGANSLLRGMLANLSSMIHLDPSTTAETPRNSATSRKPHGRKSST